MQRIHRYLAIATAVCLSGCAEHQIHDDGAVQREAMAGTEKPAPIPPPLNTDLQNGTATGGASSISTGSNRFVRAVGPARPRRTAAGPGAVTFNFEDQPVQAVVKAILGDLLKSNYTIVPGVQGNISFSTSEPVQSDQALPILETLLSWTGNALIKQSGRYVVMPAKNAVAGNLVPSLGASAPAGGLQARLFPLRYVSAKAMEKLMKPFARPDSVLLADPGSNTLVLSGTPEELANYQRTIASFDVDWMRGASVGVFNLEQASVNEVASQLDKIFGPKGDTPLAGMLRFIPINHTNSLVVISTQAAYLREVGDWIDKIDHNGGNDPQLYVYDVRNIQAADLANYLSNIYGSGDNNNQADQGGQLAPGLNGSGNASGMGAGAGSFGSSNSGGGFNNPFGGGSGNSGGMGGFNGGSGFGGNSSGGFGNNGNGNGNGNGFGNNGFGDHRSGNSAVTLNNGVRVASADGGNQLLVRARPSQWHEIESAIKRLDVNPLQVQIEARILEVTLTNEFQFGVQWFLQGLSRSTISTDSNGHTTITSTNRHGQQGALGVGGNAFQPGMDSFFYSVGNRNVQLAIHAMEDSDNTKTLSAPSLVVMNNQTAYFQVGDEVPINTASLNISGNTDNTVNSAQYIQTGVILNVQPRVNPGGLVYMNIQQQVSNREPNSNNSMGNPTISQRQINTQVAVQSGQTVLLGGLISQDDSTRSTRVPLLGDIPILGWLFGGRDHKKERREIVVLLTPRVIAGPEDARQVTNEYRDRLESMEPLRHRGKPERDNSWMRP